MALHPFRQLDVLRNASIQGDKITDCYRLLYKEALWTKAYTNLYPHKLSVSKEDFRGIVQELISQLKAGTFRFSNGKKVSHTKKTFHSLLVLKNKLVQEVIRLILSSIYTPIFSKHCYEWHERESCHVALLDIKSTWGGVTWAIPGEMKSEINPSVLLKFLAKKIDDRRFLLLIHNALIDDVRMYSGEKVFKESREYSLYPLMMSIYFHEFDLFMEEQMTILNMKEKRQRVKYVRRGNEFIIGVAGSKAAVVKVKQLVEIFLQEHLLVNLERLLLSHLAKPILFLNYEISTWKQERFIGGNGCQQLGGNTIVKSIQLKIPLKKITEFAFIHDYGRLEDFKITARPKLIHKTESAILTTYNQELVCIANYYKLAHNRHRLAKLFYMAERSFIQTIARKRRSTTTKVVKSMKKHKQGALCLVQYNKNGDQVFQSLIRLKDIIEKT